MLKNKGLRTHHQPVVPAGGNVPHPHRLLQVEVREGESDLPPERGSDPPGAGVTVGEAVGVAGTLYGPPCPLYISTTL